MHEDTSRHDATQPAARRDASLPRSAILRGRTAFADVFDGGDAARSGRLLLKYRVVEPSDPVVLVGFVMRRGSGNAVRRNRLKRLMREAYRHERRSFERQLPKGIGLHLVLLWRGSPEQASLETYDRLRADLASALGKIVHRLRQRHDERSDR